MRDVLVITPTRGRAARLAEMKAGTLRTSRAQTDIAVAVDSDDPAFDAYADLRTRADDRTIWYSGPRLSVSGWTNHVALEQMSGYRALMVLGDDHIPRTEGWDTALLAAIDGMGGTGIAYGNDLLQGQALCTAAMMSSDIVAALGWMAHPGMKHYHIDNVWQDLGQDAGCLAYCPDVILEHCHPGNGKGTYDLTYTEESNLGPGDQAAYMHWREHDRGRRTSRPWRRIKDIGGGLMHRVWDCIMLRDELEMLECRLRELDGKVHKTVLVESRTTHRGDPKPLHYMDNRERFAPWADRIIHITADLPMHPDPWVREHSQRDAALRGLADADPGDMVLIADVDEIPSAA